MRGDGRSRRVAVVADAVANPPPGAPDRLSALAAAGWGVIVLPPDGLEAAARDGWRAAIVDQVVTFAADGYEVVLAGDDAETRAIAAALAAAGGPPLPARELP